MNKKQILKMAHAAGLEIPHVSKIGDDSYVVSAQKDGAVVSFTINGGEITAYTFSMIGNQSDGDIGVHFVNGKWHKTDTVPPFVADKFAEIKNQIEEVFIQ